MEKSLRNRFSQIIWNQIEKSLKWKQDINHVTVKLNTSNFMLSKFRHIFNPNQGGLLRVSFMGGWGKITLLPLPPPPPPLQSETG